MTGRSLDLAPRCEHKPGCGCDEWYWMGQALSVIANLAIAELVVYGTPGPAAIA